MLQIRFGPTDMAHVRLLLLCIRVLLLCFLSNQSCVFGRISMETAGLPVPGYHYIAPNHIVKAPIH